MSGWRTLHAKISNENLLPDKNNISEEINSKCNHSRTTIYGDELYVLVMERDSEPLLNFAKKYAKAFDVVGLGSGDDTGPGNDSVTFYDINDGELNKSSTKSCPIVYNGLRIESTR